MAPLTCLFAAMPRRLKRLRLVDLPLTWSHTLMYAPGVRVNSALPDNKNPALKTLQEVLPLRFRRSHVPNFDRFVQIGPRFRRSVLLVHMSRKLRSR
jgi:hypothetical protein